MNEQPVCTAPGTFSGLNRHQRNGEKPCEECRRFRNEYKRNRYAANPEVRAASRTDAYRRSVAVKQLIDRYPVEYQELLAQVPK